jgi:hypothetical protein
MGEEEIEPDYTLKTSYPGGGRMKKCWRSDGAGGVRAWKFSLWFGCVRNEIEWNFVWLCVRARVFVFVACDV